MSSFDSRIEAIESAVKNVHEEHDKLSSEVHELRTDMVASRNDVLDCCMDELQNRAMRANNLIFRGIPEKMDGNVQGRKDEDALRVKGILNEMKIEDTEVLECRRLGKITGNRPRVLQVSMKNMKKKYEILRKSRMLRNSPFSKVFIHNDLTPTQQKKERMLRQELQDRRSAGEDVVIYRGNVQKRSDLKIFH